MLISIFLMATIWVSISGFLPKSDGGMTSVKYLLEKHRDTDNEFLKLELVATWVENLEELDLIRNRRAKSVKQAVILLGICLSLATVDNFIFPVCSIATLP